MLSKQLKTTLLASLGSAFEYYDFIIYASLAPYINQVFFAKTDPNTAKIQTLLVFALAYVVRPLGGLIFGLLGDRYGRKPIFRLTISLMAAATLLISLLPSFEQAGIISPLLLLAARIVQGLSYGAEMPGAITFICEHTQRDKQGRHCSILFSAVGFGVLLASILNYTLTSYLSDAQMIAFGWRIPFLLGSGLAIISYLVRRHTTETPAFAHLKTEHLSFSLKGFITNNLLQLLQGITIVLFPACLVIFYLFLPSYLGQTLGYPVTEVYRSMTGGLLWSALILPFLGWLADYIGRNKLLLITYFVAAVVLTLLFYQAWTHSLWSLLIFTLGYQTIVAAFSASYPALLAELFPANIRYTGVALCYNTAYTLAAFFPLLINYLATSLPSI